MRRLRNNAILAVGILFLGVACAPKQKITLDCIPKEVVLYVDGERLDELPSELDLRSDEPHTVFVKGPGIEPELVVLTSDEAEGRTWLSPSSICLRPRRLEVRRELEFEIDVEAPAVAEEGAAETESTTDVTPQPEFLPETF